MSLVVVGSIAFDSVKSPFGQIDEALGGSATYFSTSASYYTDVKLVAVVGDDFPESELDDLRGRGINLEGLSRQEGKTFRWAGEYGFEPVDIGRSGAPPFSRREPSAHSLDRAIDAIAPWDGHLDIAGNPACGARCELDRPCHTGGTTDDPQCRLPFVVAGSPERRPRRGIGRLDDMG